MATKVTKRKIIRKVISPVVPGVGQIKSKEIKEVAVEQKEAPRFQADFVEEQVDRSLKRAKKECFFCKNKSIPSYTDLSNLRRYLTDRAKIVGKERTGICSKHQRGITKNIKYARHLALLPFVPKV